MILCIGLESENVDRTCLNGREFAIRVENSVHVLSAWRCSIMNCFCFCLRKPWRSNILFNNPCAYIKLSTTLNQGNIK